ncbi:ankyrin repeat domain-containing protein [Brasilonema sp. UFV-L1]|nr:ankyrin repeat domain-containing protein [Brasilonema sp. UFV-L1]NMG11345.1 hypothetical protein [Brasilonema sp. UFV-L1]
MAKTTLSWQEIVDDAPKNRQPAQSYYQQAIRRYLETGGDVKAKEQNGITLLHLAAYTGDRSLFQLLLDRGADVNAQALNGANLPFYIALDNPWGAFSLLFQQPNLNQQTNKSFNMLLWAVAGGDRQIVQLL